MAAVAVMGIGAAIALAAAGDPTATISAPADNQTYTINQVVATTFKCVHTGNLNNHPEYAIASCKDSNGVGTAVETNQHGALDTSSLGNATYKVTATNVATTAKTATIHYTVKANTRLSDLTITFGPSHDATLSAVLTRTDNGNGLNNRTVSFRTGSIALCSDTTGPGENEDGDPIDGVATCTVTLSKAAQSSLTQTLTATFAAAGNFFGTSTTVKGPQGGGK